MRGIRTTVVAAAVALAIAVSGCGIVGGGGGYEVVAWFPRAVSLYETGSVQVLGLPAGRVSDIEVVGDEVKVTMSISDDIRLPADVQAAIIPQSLIGERRVQLFPVYREGQTPAEDGHVIPAERTIVPVEPDEALAALKEFLDSLNPDGLGSLIDNAATALDGQGENLGLALSELSGLVANFEANDDDIISIAEKFDDFTTTLLTREDELAEALDDFAVVVGVLADERDDIESLVTGLAELSGAGFDLVAEHAVRLRTDVDIVTRLVRAVDTNLDSVGDLLDATPALIAGFENSFDADLRAFRLRQNFSPLVAEALGPLFDSIGVPLPCVPLDVVCPGSTGSILGLSPAEATEATLSAATTPVDDVLALLAGPTEAPAAAPSRRSTSGLGDLIGTFLGVR